MTEEIIIKRLSLIKHLYTVGIEQSNQSELIAYSSILSFHDSIDMFMLLAAEKKGIAKKERDKLFLMDFFSKIPELTLKASVKRINDRRNSLKHNGQIPAKIEIEESRTIAKLFFEQNTLLIFNKEFNKISLLNLITYEIVRTLLQTAEELRGQNSKDKAIMSTAKAFYELLHVDDNFRVNNRIYFHFEMLAKTHGFSKAISPAFSGLGKGWEAQRKAETFDRFIDDTLKLYNKNFEKIEESLNIVSLGIDYRKYTKFKYLTPWVQKSFEGKWVESPIHNINNITEENLQFLIDFVLECALKLQEFELV